MLPEQQDPSDLHRATASNTAGLESFPTLKKSISASFANGHRQTSPRRHDPREDSPAAAPLPPRTARATPPNHVNISKPPPSAETALAALQYLYVPLLVLSNLKTVILANDAMGHLLGLQRSRDQATDGSTQEKDTSVTDLLKGQFLSQIGIDMVQDGQPIWVSWERFLDVLAEEMDTKAALSAASVEQAEFSAIVDGESAAGGELGPVQQGASKTPPKSTTGAPVVHDSAVDVILTSQVIRSSKQERVRHDAPDRQVYARMVISVWALEGQRYFTLAFTKSSEPKSSSPSQTQSRAVSQASKSIGVSPAASDGSEGQGRERCTICGAVKPAAQTSPTGQSLFLTSPPTSHAAVTPSFLQKSSRMKKAMLDAMEIPIFVMWKDESLAFPNKAAMKLMGKTYDPTTEDVYDLSSRFVAYAEDFSCELAWEEYPIVQLCRSQTPFQSVRIGLKDVQGRSRIFDVSGEGIYDQKTGEFLAGMTTFKDVTVYTELLKSQHDQSEEQFEMICRLMPAVLWTATTEGVPDWFSQRWYDYTGMRSDWSLADWRSCFHPDDLDETNKRWSHSLRTGDEYVIEYRCRRADGAWRWMTGRAVPLRDVRTGTILKWFGTVHDTDDLVQAHISANRMREQLLTVIKNAKVSIWSIDRQRRVDFVEGVEGLGHDEIMGQDIYKVIRDHFGGQESVDVFQPLIEEILAGEVHQHVCENFNKQTNQWFRTRFAAILTRGGRRPHQQDGTVMGVVATAYDVTELKERTEKLQTQKEENVRLLLAETAAKEASRLKSQFLANMSHEIRTPIAGVIGMSELLIDTDLDEDQTASVENILRSAQQLLTVINDILDLSKVESGRLDIEEVQFSLSVVVRDVGKMMAFAAERKDLMYLEDIQIGLQEDRVVLGDPGRCRQILTNLLTNSIKFTSEGHVKLTVKIESETAETVTILFAVEDTGIGFDDEVQRKLFKPFSQADSSTARRFGGTGLGLTICKNLVDLMHGQIRLESTMGAGTTATFTIPFNKSQFETTDPLVHLNNVSHRLESDISVSGCGSDVDRSPLPDMPRMHGAVQSPALGTLASNSNDGKANVTDAERKQTHILVVEDNAINQQIALRTIKKLGFSATAVWNGQEALDYLKQGFTPEHVKPDVVLMDVQMPILDGYRTTHRIRHHDPFMSIPGMSAIPIIAMTASAIQGDRERCERAGMDDYMPKPVKQSTLEGMLVKWLLHRRDGTSSSPSGGGALRPRVGGLPRHSNEAVQAFGENDSSCTECASSSLTGPAGGFGATAPAPPTRTRDDARASAHSVASPAAGTASASSSSAPTPTAATHAAATTSRRPALHAQALDRAALVAAQTGLGTLHSLATPATPGADGRSNAAAAAAAATTTTATAEAERATVLRTDKLLAAAGDTAPRSPSAELPRGAGPLPALTEENVGILGRAHAAANVRASREARGLDADNTDPEEEEGAGSAEADAGEGTGGSSRAASLLGELRAPRTSRASLGMNRQMSDRSQATVRPDDPGLGGAS